MAEYIEREKVMQKFADHVKRSNNSDFAPVPTWNQAVQIVEDFPAADVRPVVLCKDCKYNVANMYHDPLDCCDYTDITCSYFMTDGMEPYDFCSVGQKMEEADV